MNEDNLIPNSERTPEELREMCRKGGIASGKVRRERKAFKEALLLALETMKDGKTIQELGVEALMQKFISGDIQAFTTVRDTVGEKPTDKVDLNNKVSYEKTLKEMQSEDEY